MRHRIPAFATQVGPAPAAGVPCVPAAAACPSVSAAAPAPAPALPDAPPLHPGVWRAAQLARPAQRGLPTGWPELDAELPGGGWPCGQLTELLLPGLGVGEMRLLAPVLLRVAAEGRCVMLFDPPATLCGWALAQLGVPPDRLLVVHGREGARAAATVRHLLPSADLLWALEQALRCGHVGAILAWPPPRLKADALRRLQLAAQSHEGPVFLLRALEERLRPSPAPLRLGLGSAGPDHLGVRVLKRRGPALASALVLPLPPVLSAPLAARAAARRAVPTVATMASMAVPPVASVALGDDL